MKETSNDPWTLKIIEKRLLEINKKKRKSKRNFK